MEKILIVNNDPDTLLLLQDLLQLKGYKVMLNTVKEQVPAMIANFQPDLVLLDITRQEVMDEIKKQAGKDSIPVLLMTGHNSYPGNKENGFKYFIKKPFVLDELLKKIESILNIRVITE